MIRPAQAADSAAIHQMIMELDEWVVYRLTGPALHALAGDGS